MRASMFQVLCLAVSGFAASAACAQVARKPIPAPVIFDTDIGTDIDDAYALVALIRRPELDVLGVTTVSGDAVARARLAAKLLAVAGGRWVSLPVYAGTSGTTQYMKQVEWADGFNSPNLHTSGGVEFMRREINARPGAVTIIAVGELTNVAALLEADPAIAQKIRAIALMGGAIYRGYAPGSKPEPEWNIKSNAAAARTVFTAGVPLLVAPLDSTADLRLTPEMRVQLFSRGTPLNDALAALNSIWRHTNTWKGENPTLFDVLAVELVMPRRAYELTALHIEVATDGTTKPVAGGKPNAQIALKVDEPLFMREFVERLTR
jgi:purine nucleosidase